MEDEVCDCAIEDLLKQSFSCRDFATKKRIIETGRPIPFLTKMVKLSKNRLRHFSDSWYNTDLWLCGCKKSSSLYCWPCLLFSTERNMWTTNGVSDIASFYVLKKRHELSVNHVNSKIALLKFGNTQIEDSLSPSYKIDCEKHNEKVKANRYIVSCFIDAICYLAQQELPFRGHLENTESENRGNYLEYLHRRARYDEKLRVHLETSTLLIGTSHDIQNDLIDSISTVMINKIKEEVKQTHFVSIIEDVVVDVSGKSQLSSVLRYVTPDGSVQERFIRFSDVSQDRSAASLSVHVFNLINEFRCGEKLVAQTYDGAAVMVGEHNGLQELIRDKYETAFFVHCYAHQLNLVLRQSVECIPECKVFFETLSGFASFFSKSSKRLAAFDKLVTRRLPSVAPTIWLYAERLVEVISQLKTELINFFKSVTNDTKEWDGETRISARGYYEILQDFDFNFYLKVFSGVLPQAKELFEIMQTIGNISYCSKIVEEFQNFLTEKLNSFEEVWSESVSCSQGDEHSELLAKRPRIAVINNDQKIYYQRLYREIIDTMKGQLTNRFSEILKLKFVSLLDFGNFKHYSEMFPAAAYESLLLSYGRYFDALLLKTELSVIYSSEEFLKSNISDLLRYLITSNLNTALPEVTKLSALLLTIPTTSASVEGSFSALKRVNTYLHSTQTQERLTKLSLMTIEKRILQDLESSPNFCSSVIDIFSEKNSSVELKYKV
ncbi:zinc finger MYM-type protein 1-like [Zootermopsis nevadensis]|uniref:Zinc finger MYM-type protein 1 n=1 Tax=Zootermopsis nevadensis TaxID=136037 RepID=A0A067R633_ZOONE|nr:zinc finger MYM-type protein 1-like [Zootermopsis nevadensis]XP_021921061.1 zinc finger MYM-type protein 1-like [Zootermopsis nevadensis]KDR18839.1 Zinc finger MYM-type protein 1 [Zootermopsis nevadensis]